MPVDLFTLNNGKDRLLNAEVRRLLGYTGNNKYHVLPPLLYPPGEEGQQSQLFRNPTLLKVCFVLSPSQFVYHICINNHIYRLVVSFSLVRRLSLHRAHHFDPITIAQGRSGVSSRFPLGLLLWLRSL